MPDEPDVRAYGVVGNRQYVLFVEDEPVCMACVGETRFNDDGDLELEASLKLIWTPPDRRKHGYGRALVDALRQKFPEIAHDGNLSSHGTKFVDAVGLPHDGRHEPEPYDDADAERTGADTWAKWAAEHLDS